MRTSQINLWSAIFKSMNQSTNFLYGQTKNSSENDFDKRLNNWQIIPDWAKKELTDYAQGLYNPHLQHQSPENMIISVEEKRDDHNQQTLLLQVANQKNPDLIDQIVLTNTDPS
jgi:hypothetical protein